MAYEKQTIQINLFIVDDNTISLKNLYLYESDKEQGCWKCCSEPAGVPCSLISRHVLNWYDFRDF